MRLRKQMQDGENKLLMQSLQAAFISFQFSMGTIVASGFPLLSTPTISHSAQ